MASRPPFLNRPYGAYEQRDIPKEDEELLHVGPGTPGGEYLRRFWQPVAYAEELQDLPLRTRILGEDLVVFRDRSGRVGLLQLYCSHRGTSLEFGQLSERGIRCCYHGWLFDADGTILETPGEPSDSTLKDRLFHGAYPTLEYRGIVFGYMGPPDKKPAFPLYDCFDLPGYCLKPMPKHVYPCNWLQVKENSMDPAHLDFLHTIEGNIGFSRDLRLRSELDWMETPVGMVYMSTRRVGDRVWVRTADFMPPNIHQFPSAIEGGKEVRYGPPDTTRWTVPVDDRHTVIFSYKHVPLSREHEPVVLGFGQTDERPYEDRQRVPGDYDAQMSIHGGMACHALEHLASTDRGVIMLRNIVRQGIRAVQKGEDPQGLTRKVGEVLPTYCGDTVLSMPPAPTPEADQRLLRETGRKVAEDYMRMPPAHRVQAI